MQAARIILDRLAPVRRGRPVRFEAPATIDATGIVEAFNNLVTAIAAGEMTPEEGIAVANVLELGRKAIETEQTEVRLRAIEEQLETVRTQR
jgi:hypothetical protein